MKNTSIFAFLVLGICLSESCAGTDSDAAGAERPTDKKEMPMTGVFVDTLEDNYSLQFRSVNISQLGADGSGRYSVKVHAIERFKDSKDNVDKVTDREWNGVYNPISHAIEAENQLDVVIVPDSGRVRIGQAVFYKDPGSKTPR